MLSTAEVIEFVGCDPSTLKRAIRRGELSPERREEGNFFDREAVLKFAQKVKARQLKHSPQSIKTPKEKAQIPPRQKVRELIVADTQLNQIGLEALQTTTADLTRLGLYDECDKQVLLAYALTVQAWNRFFVLAWDTDAIAENAAGNLTVHPYHKALQFHEKQMLSYMDRLGLTPLARLKFNIKEPEPYDEMEALLARHHARER